MSHANDLDAGTGCRQPAQVGRRLTCGKETAHQRGKKVRAHCAWRHVILECVEAGIDSVSVAPDTLLDVKRRIAAAEAAA